MKTTLLLAFSVAFIFASCSKSLVDEAAASICNCQAMKDMAALQKSVDGKSDEEKAAIMPKMMELSPKIKACMASLEEKVKALKPEEQAKFQTDLEAAVTKKCPEMMPKK